MSDRKRTLAIDVTAAALAIPTMFAITGCSGDRSNQSPAPAPPQASYDPGPAPVDPYYGAPADSYDPGVAPADPYYYYDDSQSGGQPYQEQTQGGYVGGDGQSSYYFDPSTGCSVVPGEGVSC
jgi:hypothetical protein